MRGTECWIALRLLEAGGEGATLGQRTRVLALTALVGVVTVVDVVAVDGARGGSANAPRMNVVVVLVDDMAVNELQYMPKVERLIAARGVSFDNTFDNTPVCCPSRATLLTGQHSRHHGVRTNKPYQGQGYQALDSTNTFATWMSAAGYRSIFIGKYLTGYGQYDAQPGVPNNREVPPWMDGLPGGRWAR